VLLLAAFLAGCQCCPCGSGRDKQSPTGGQPSGQLGSVGAGTEGGVTGLSAPRQSPGTATEDEAAAEELNLRMRSGEGAPRDAADPQHQEPSTKPLSRSTKTAAPGAGGSGARNLDTGTEAFPSPAPAVEEEDDDDGFGSRPGDPPSRRDAGGSRVGPDESDDGPEAP
jgi:hypothetical protein